MEHAEALPAPVPAADGGWTEEEVFFSGDLYFAAVERSIHRATKSVDFESYIFENDVLGRRMVTLLADAARRGLVVRVMVDGIGSPGWVKRFGHTLSSAGAQYKVFHELPWDRYARGCPPGQRRVRLQKLLRSLNVRNHRKLIIVDGEEAFIGSMNVAAYHLESALRERSWRDTGARVRGPGVADLQLGFDYIWGGRRKRQKLREQLSPPKLSPYVRLNVTSRMRRKNYFDIVKRIQGARKRIWVENAYFLPHGRILRELSAAARRGVDVTVLVPARSDVPFMPWASLAYSVPLVRAGAKICEYLPRMLHAKVLLIDDWVSVGSTNLNSRSVLHDLESDVVLCHPSSLRAIERQFEVDLQTSACVDSRWFTLASWWKRFLGRIFLLFRYWL